MKALQFLEGFLIGGVIGAAVALILAPASGNELRGRVRNEAEHVQFEVKRAAEVRRSELEQQLAALRSPKKHTAV